MNRLVLGCLGLALGCLLVRGQAQEVEWRSAGSRPAAGFPASPDAPAPATRPTGLAVSLRGPVPLAESLTPGSEVQTVAFSQDAPAFVARAKAFEAGQQMPVGPPAENGPEQLTMPREFPAPGTPKDTGSMDSWGGEITPYGAASPGIGVAVGPDGGCGVSIGDDCCGCCGGDSCCGEGFCGCCNNCCRLPRVWASAEMLLWWIKGNNLPPLITETTLSATDLATLKAVDPAFRPGALGQPGTSLLLGNQSIGSGFAPGGRFTIGVAIPGTDVGIEGTFFFLSQQVATFSASSSGQPGLYRPFFDVNPTVAGNPAPDSEFVAFPTLLSGNIMVRQTSSIWGVDVNARAPIFCGCNCSLDILGGFRIIGLDEGLDISENITFLKSFMGVAAGDNIQLLDSFHTHNDFWGGQIGFDFEYKCNRWTFGLLGKLAVGGVHETVNINGVTTFTPAAGTPVTAPGGLLAQPSNIGTFSTDHFAVAPEGGLKVAYQLTDHLQAYAGYNLLYISNVVRPAEQIDTVVNTSQAPPINVLSGGVGALTGPARPVVLLRTTDFWAQGFSLGLKFAW